LKEHKIIIHNHFPSTYVLYPVHYAVVNKFFFTITKKYDIILDEITTVWRVNNMEKRDTIIRDENNELPNRISHEIRTHLTNIKAFTQLLISNPERDVKSRMEFLNIINDEVDRLTQFLDELHSLTQVEGSDAR